MGVWKYKHITPTIIADKLSLIKPKDLVELADKDMEQVYSMLTKTPYNPEISAISAQERNFISFETALLKHLMKTYEKIAENSPKDVRVLVYAFLKKFEADNIKTLLRFKLAGVNTEEALRFITPIGKLDESRCRKILENSKSLRDVVEQLLTLEYGLVLTEPLLEFEKTGNILLLEVALDKYVYAQLWTAVEKLKGLDKKIAKTVVGTQIFSANVRIILRSKAEGFSQDEMMRHLIIVPEVFDEKGLEEVAKTTDVKECIKKMLETSNFAATKDWQYMLKDIAKGFETSRSLEFLDTALDRSLLRTNLQMLRRYTSFFNVGSILAFMNLKWVEVKNLNSIMKGLEDGFSPNEIKTMLLLPD